MTRSELDDVVIKEVMNWVWSCVVDGVEYYHVGGGPIGWFTKEAIKLEPGQRSAPNGRPDFSPTKNFNDAMTVVLELQKRNPGWRFSLLGGDMSMGYVRDADGWLVKDENEDVIVVESPLVPFGWKAEFFGHEDPRKNCGQRHGEGRHVSSPMIAICLAAVAANRSLVKTQTS